MTELACRHLRPLFWIKKIEHYWKSLVKAWSTSSSFAHKSIMRCNYFDIFLFPFFFFFSCSFEKEMAVNKYGHDSMEALPVPIKPWRDHHNERWPWHNLDSSQQKPDSWSERERRECWFKKKKKKNERRVLKTQHKYCFDIMRKRPHIWRGYTTWISMSVTFY